MGGQGVVPGSDRMLEDHTFASQLLEVRRGAAAIAVSAQVIGSNGVHNDQDQIEREWGPAHLLYRLFHAGEGSVEQVPFSTILPALARGEADFGVCIHEGRFTWQRYGLEFVQDVGAAWERHANSPLPLGGIVARKRLGRARLLALDRAVRASLDYARSHPDDAFRTMREHAQELEDEALWKHVELYVNAWTRDLGTEGREALRRIASCARVSGWIREDATGLEVLEPG